VEKQQNVQVVTRVRNFLLRKDSYKDRYYLICHSKPVFQKFKYVQPNYHNQSVSKKLRYLFERDVT